MREEAVPVLATVLTFLSTRIVSVVVTTVVVVAAVPTAIVAVHGHTITITSGRIASSIRHTGDAQKAGIVGEVRAAADQVIVQLNNQEASCDSQIAQLAAKSKLSATATANAMQEGTDEFHTTVVPFVNELRADEDELAHLSDVTSDTEQIFLVRINEVKFLALGEEGQSGLLISTCRTIVLQITQIVVVQSSSPGADAGDGT
ncbi:MAG TPA: hypothetical protein VNA65_00025 [Candidatus Dormibacteraeota bacterium]|nr:hypothetical protein [Candidatus Dormibacteraeota bacterium]